MTDMKFNIWDAKQDENIKVGYDLKTSEVEWQRAILSDEIKIKTIQPNGQCFLCHTDFILGPFALFSLLFSSGGIQI